MLTHYLLNNIIRGQKYLHGGFELCDNKPINSGLGFTEEELNNYSFDNLPLFSRAKQEWIGNNIIDEIKEINDLFKSLNINESH